MTTAECARAEDEAFSYTPHRPYPLRLLTVLLPLDSESLQSCSVIESGMFRRSKACLGRNNHIMEQEWPVVFPTAPEPAPRVFSPSPPPEAFLMLLSSPSSSSFP
jgi:hypothetical protein